MKGPITPDWGAIAQALGYGMDMDVLKDKLQHLEIPLADATKKGQPKRLWVVVKTEHGVPVMVDAFRDKRAANRRANFLQMHMQPDREQVTVFDIPNPARNPTQPSPYPEQSRRKGEG